MKGSHPKRTENQNAGTLELLYKQRIEELWNENIMRTENQNAGTLELLNKQRIEDIWKENILRGQRTKMLEPKNCCINNGLTNYERKIS